MISKGNKIYSILTGACPKCHQESMYVSKNPYILSETLKINDKCSNCNTTYRMEPSFFYGSMYVSYAVGIGVAVIAFLVSFFLFKSSLIVAFISIVLMLIVTSPIIMRLSRNIWINMFMHFDPELVNKK